MHTYSTINAHTQNEKKIEENKEMKKIMRKKKKEKETNKTEVVELVVKRKRLRLGEG